MAVVQEAYVNGVSTRKVDRLVEQLDVAQLSKDQVSPRDRPALRRRRDLPNDAALIRLAGSLLIEQNDCHEGWHERRGDSVLLAPQTRRCSTPLP